MSGVYDVLSCSPCPQEPMAYIDCSRNKNTHLGRWERYVLKAWYGPAPLWLSLVRPILSEVKTLPENLIPKMLDKDVIWYCTMPGQWRISHVGYTEKMMMAPYGMVQNCVRNATSKKMEGKWQITNYELWLGLTHEKFGGWLQRTSWKIFCNMTPTHIFVHAILCAGKTFVQNSIEIRSWVVDVENMM
jgi:hypothetical protein